MIESDGGGRGVQSIVAVRRGNWNGNGADVYHVLGLVGRGDGGWVLEGELASARGEDTGGLGRCFWEGRRCLEGRDES